MTYLYFDNILLNGFRSGPFRQALAPRHSPFWDAKRFLAKPKSPGPASNVDAPKGALSWKGRSDDRGRPGSARATS